MSAHPEQAAPRAEGCPSCRWWDDRGELGLCRANAPEPARLIMQPPSGGKAREMVRGLWPITTRKDWCGDWMKVARPTPTGG